MTRHWRESLNHLIHPFLVAASVLLIADHWRHFDAGDFILLVMMSLALCFRIRAKMDGRQGKESCPVVSMNRRSS